MLSALGLVVLLGACTGETIPTIETTSTSCGGTTSTIPEPTAGELAQPEARALLRAWAGFAGIRPPCIGTDTPAALRAAIAEGSDGPVEYFQPNEDLQEPESGGYRCSVLVLDRTE
jgi:hypothetical protein